MTDNNHKKTVEMYIPSYNFEQFKYRPKANFKIILNKERKGKVIMKRCSIIEYEDEVIVEFYDQQTKERLEYKFDDWDEAFEALPEIGL